MSLKGEGLMCLYEPSKLSRVSVGRRFDVPV